MKRLDIPEVVDYETYQKATDALVARSFIIFLVICIVIFLIAVGCFFRRKVTKKKPNIVNYIIVLLFSSITIGVILLTISALKEQELSEKTLNTPNLVYKWEQTNTFQLNQVKLTKKSESSMILTVTSEEKDPIDLNAVFTINRDNTVIRSSEKVGQEKIVIEQQVLTDKRFEFLSTSTYAKGIRLSNLLGRPKQYAPPQVRWVFYVDERSKELLQLWDLDL
ncbi:hypothetical protein ACOJIU_18840 (plasmid) [Carnobacterium maltaromaticum]|uniref:hypothetical protein n=1 Tax=Carnobacterium maltaromaticum TaxID=2751 RepID=UPI00344F4193